MLQLVVMYWYVENYLVLWDNSDLEKELENESFLWLELAHTVMVEELIRLLYHWTQELSCASSQFIDHAWRVSMNPAFFFEREPCKLRRSFFLQALQCQPLFQKPSQCLRSVKWVFTMAALGGYWFQSLVSAHEDFYDGLIAKMCYPVSWTFVSGNEQISVGRNRAYINNDLWLRYRGG